MSNLDAFQNGLPKRYKAPDRPRVVEPSIKVRSPFILAAAIQVAFARSFFI